MNDASSGDVGDWLPGSQGAGRIVTLGLLASAAIVLQMIEAPLPRPLPWLRLGLANSVTLVTLILFDLSSALTVVVVRQVGTHLLLGTLMAPSFILGLLGAATATFVMSAVRRFSPRRGLIIISIFGAVAHNGAQLAAASLLLGHGGVWYHFPFMITLSLPSGAIIALLARSILLQMKASSYVHTT